VNIAWTLVVSVVVGWSLISILVALAFGGVARSRDDQAAPLVDHDEAPARIAPILRDEGVRTAI
jgi:hypothetical protein